MNPGTGSWQVTVSLALLVAVVCSGLLGVHARHEARQLFIELQRAEVERDNLQIEWGQLQIEQAALSTHGRVEALVREELSMRPPRPEEIELVLDPYGESR